MLLLYTADFTAFSKIICFPGKKDWHHVMEIDLL